MVSKKHKLTACRITLKPQLSEEENITIAENVSDKIEMVKTPIGYVLKGQETSKVYEKFLRELKYTHEKPISYKTRQFTVGCSTDDDKVFSNLVTVMVTFIKLTLLTYVKIY